MQADRHLSRPLNFYFFCWGEKEKARNSVYKKAITPLLSRPEEPRLGRGAVASWLVCTSPDRAVWVRALAGDIVLCSWARHCTLTLPEKKYSYSLHVRETGISSVLMGYDLARLKNLIYLYRGLREIRD